MKSDMIYEINKRTTWCAITRYLCSDKISQIGIHLLLLKGCDRYGFQNEAFYMRELALLFTNSGGQLLDVKARQFIDASLRSLEDAISELRSLIDGFDIRPESSTGEDLHAIYSARDEIDMSERIINDWRHIKEFIDDNWRAPGDNTECEGTRYGRGEC